MKIDYGQVLTIYGAIKKKIDDIEDNINSINNKVNQLQSKELWDGNGYNNYKSKINKFTSEYINYLIEFKSANEYLNKVITNYQNVDSEVIRKASSTGGAS